jgi:signal transduction histidine kinase
VLGNEVDITRQKEAEEILRASEEQLKKWSARLLQQQEIERRDVARGIHEGIAQCLSAIKLRVESVLGEVGGEGPDSPMNALKPIVSDVQQSVRSIRRMDQNLSPLLLDDMGVGSAISWVCRETANAYSNLRIEQHIDLEEPQIPEDRKIVVFRTIEDVLKSLSSHGKACLVEIVLQGIEGHLVLTIKTRLSREYPDLPVSDRGPLDLLDAAKLRRRIESCGGEFGFENHPDKSTMPKASWHLP